MTQIKLHGLLMELVMIYSRNPCLSKPYISSLNTLNTTYKLTNIERRSFSNNNVLSHMTGPSLGPDPRLHAGLS
jgi:hypothetical protein